MQEYSLTVEGSVHAVTAADLNDLSIQLLPDGSYHLILDQVGYQCKILRFDGGSKAITVSVNGREYLIEVADRYDQIVKELGFVTTEINTSKDLYAPMPGLVLDILVDEGDEIESGTPLMILEAMKMENLLKADGDGKVMGIQVAKGAAVDKRQLLIEIQ